MKQLKNTCLKNLRPSAKKSLIVDNKKVDEDKLEEKAFARIKVTRQGDKIRNNIEEVITDEQHSLAYSPQIILAHNKKYVLNFPLRCLFAKEEDYYVVSNEQLDLIGTGETQDEAELNFNEEFDYLFTRLNSLNDSNLNSRLLRIKFVINSFVKEIL